MKQRSLPVAVALGCVLPFAACGSRGSSGLESGPATAPAASSSLALVGGTLINPDQAPVRDAVVVIRDGRVVCAGPRAACIPPTGVRTVDVSGAYVGSGLVDAHMHYSWNGWVDTRPDVIDLRDRFRLDSALTAIQRAPELTERALLCAGVTSVFDAGGYRWTLERMRSREDAPLAPRMAGAGAIHTTRESEYDRLLNLPSMAMFVVLTDESVTRAAVRANAALGARAIKIGYLRAADSIRVLPLLAAVVEEARAAGIPVAVHVQSLAGTKQVLRAGAKLLVHVVGPEALDDEALALLRTTGAIVVPTLTVWEGLSDIFAGRLPSARYPLDCVDPQTRAHFAAPLSESLRQPGLRLVAIWDSLIAASKRNVRRLRDAGIPMAVGTDAGNPGTAHGPSIYREMELLQSAGLTAREVFAAATLGGARVLGRERELGSLEAGKLADLVVFDEDPTVDVRNARRIRWIMKAGVLHSRDSLLPR